MDSNQVPPTAPMPPQSNNTLMAVLAYLGILIIIPFLAGAKDEPFVKFHIKQGLALIIVWIVSNFVHVVPFFGWILGSLLNLGCLILMIMGIINALGGQMKELPLIGQIGRNFNF